MAYPTVTAGDVLEAVLQANGFDPDYTTLTANEKQQYGLLVNHALRIAWEAELWPQLMVIERRTYRPTYDATQLYNSDHEVYYDGAYWKSLADANTGNTPADDSDWWTDCTADMIPYLAFDQAWETRTIDETGVDWARCVFTDDPQKQPAAAPVPGCRAYEQSILIPLEDAPLRPYVRFRPTRPKISYTEYVAGTEYTTGQLCYRTATGRSYLALQPSTGKTPEENGDYWSPVDLPEMFVDFIRLHTRMERATEDEGKYKSQAAADNELERLREVYLRVSADAGQRKVRWRSGR